MSTVIKRPTKELKEHVVTIRLTTSELKEIQDLSDAMQFETVREFFMFTVAVSAKLFEWHRAGNRFYRIQGLTSDEEIDFEFEPQAPKKKI